MRHRLRLLKISPIATSTMKPIISLASNVLARPPRASAIAGVKSRVAIAKNLVIRFMSRSQAVGQGCGQVDPLAEGS